MGHENEVSDLLFEMNLCQVKIVNNCEVYCSSYLHAYTPIAGNLFIDTVLDFCDIDCCNSKLYV